MQLNQNRVPYDSSTEHSDTNTLTGHRAALMESPANAETAELPSAADSPTDTPAPAYALSVALSVGVLAIIALIATLYLARAFFVPLLVGILASYALHPLVDWLKLCRVPRAVGAALVLVILVGGLTWIVYSLSDDATAMIDKLPETARKLRQDLRNMRTGPTALENMRETAKQLEGAAADAGAKPGTRVIVSQPSEPTTWLRDYALAQSALLFTFAAQAPIVLLLTYFLLASGAHFRLKLMQIVGPTLSRRKVALLILNEIDGQIQRYLLSVLISNVLVGIGTWLVFKALGIEHAALWGVIAGVMHFIPYLGPALVALASGVTGFLQFGSVFMALSAAGLSLLVAGAIGLVFMTWLQSRFAHVNAAVLFIALLFFAWLWGVWGLLLGSPLVAIAKVIWDRVEFSRLMGRGISPPEHSDPITARIK
jgi:predicted PurR-regulated permease PerM